MFEFEYGNLLYTWSDQTLNKALNLKKYIQRDSICDVTLVSDDYQKFQAYKIVLAANSAVLEMLLLNCTQTDAIHIVLHIRGFNGLQIRHLVHTIIVILLIYPTP